MATLVLLHGAWQSPACWDLLRERLEGLGHRTMAPELPLHDPSAGYEERISPAIEALDGVDGPVTVVAHSQSSALGPLVAVARPVSRLVYLCPRMGGLEPPADAPAPFQEGIPWPDDSGGLAEWDPEVAMRFMYGRLPSERARDLVRGLRPMAMPPGEYPLEEHPRVPTALLYATEDEFFRPDFERFMAREALGIEPIEIEGGHFPMVEDPGALAGRLDRLPAV